MEKTQPGELNNLLENTEFDSRVELLTATPSLAAREGLYHQQCTRGNQFDKNGSNYRQANIYWAPTTSQTLHYVPG